MSEEIYGFWDYLFPLFVGLAAGCVILLGVLTTEAKDTRFNVSLFSMIALGFVFASYLMFFSIQQIDS